MLKLNISNKVSSIVMQNIRLLFLILLLQACKEKHYDQIVIADLPEETVDAQYKIVSILSGNESVGTEKDFISSRTTQKERQLSRDFLSGAMTQLGMEPIEHSYKEPNDNPLIDLLLAPFKGTNLYAILPGTTESEEFIVIGAHYDTARNCPGANDNASAVAVIYGIIKKLKEVPQRKKNVIVVFFDQEEENLVGSRAFAKYLYKEKYKLHSVHTLDQLGWDKDLDKAIELELPSPEIEEIYRAQANRLNIPIFTTRVNSTDHKSFRDLGFNAVGITEEFVNGDTTPFKDTEKDTLETVDIDYINSTTILIFNVIKKLITEN